MAKKKIKLKAVFKTKFTRTQIFFSLIFVVILFTCLWLFFFLTNSGLQYRMLISSRLLQAENNYYSYLQSLTPTPKPIPKPSPMVAASAPPVTFYPSTNNCQTVGYTRSQAATVIAVYSSKANNNRYDTLHLIVVCGTPSQGGYATQFTLIISEGMISSSQFSYADASPPGPTTKNTCSLSVIGSHSAEVTCGERSFILSY